MFLDNKQYKIFFLKREHKKLSFTFDLTFYLGHFLHYAQEAGAETEYSNLFKLGREGSEFEATKASENLRVGLDRKKLCRVVWL